MDCLLKIYKFMMKALNLKGQNEIYFYYFYYFQILDISFTYKDIHKNKMIYILILIK